jgi:hypothetical protein
VLLFVLRLCRGLLLLYWCCALLFGLSDGLGDWSTGTDGLLSVVGLRTRETIM